MRFAPDRVSDPDPDPDWIRILIGPVDPDPDFNFCSLKPWIRIGSGSGSVLVSSLNLWIRIRKKLIRIRNTGPGYLPTYSSEVCAGTWRFRCGAWRWCPGWCPPCGSGWSTSPPSPTSRPSPSPGTSTAPPRTTVITWVSLWHFCVVSWRYWFCSRYWSILVSSGIKYSKTFQRT